MGRLQFISDLKKRLYSWSATPEKVYLGIALVGVIGFVFITPPFQGPDEEAHYIRAQYIAHGYFIPSEVGSTNASLPKSIMYALNTTFFNDDLRGRTSEKYEIQRTIEALKMPLNESDQYKPPMISYNFLTYLPAIPGILLANLFNASPIVSLYIARLLLALAAIALIFTAIKIMPSKKFLLAVLSLLPMMLYQQSVVGTDGVSYAILILFIAYTLSLFAQRTPITRKQWIIMIAICCSMMWAKPLLYLFVPLLVILAKKKGALKWLGGLAVACVLFIGLNNLMAANAGVYEYNHPPIPGAPTNTNADLQLSNIKDHPQRWLRVLWNSYMTQFGDDETRSVIGVFGPADAEYPLWMSYSFILVIGSVILLQFETKKLVINKWWRLLAVGLCCVHFMAVNLAIYLGYTPYNFDIVYGVQGRYFLPIAIILPIALTIGTGIAIKKRDQAKIRLWVSLGILALVLLAVLILYQRYFMFTP